MQWECREKCNEMTKSGRLSEELNRGGDLKFVSGRKERGVTHLKQRARPL